MGARLRVVDEPVVGDRPERVVALAVAAPVEPVPFRLAAGRFDRRGTAERSECGVAAHAVGVVAGDHEQFRGRVGSDAGLGEQSRGGGLRERVQLALELGDLAVELLPALGQAPQRPLRRRECAGASRRSEAEATPHLAGRRQSRETLLSSAGAVMTRLRICCPAWVRALIALRRAI